MKVVAAAASVLERLATVRIGRVQVVSENVSLSLAGLLSHSDKSVRSAAIAALRVASDSIEGRRTLASCDDVAMLLTQSLCCTDPVDGAFYCFRIFYPHSLCSWQLQVKQVSKLFKRSPTW